MKTVAILAVAGLAAGAQAQKATWIADVDAPVGGNTATVSLSLSMEANAPFVALSATIFDTLNVDGMEHGEIVGWEVKNNLADLTGDLTTTDGHSLFGTNAGQLTVFGPFSSDNPIEVLCFTWEGAEITEEGRAVSYETATQAMVLWIGEDKDTAVSVDADANDAAFGWFVVPSPASAALLGLGGLALARRRR